MAYSGAGKKSLLSDYQFGILRQNPEPDIVFSSAGDYLTKESKAAIDLLKQEAPWIKGEICKYFGNFFFGIGNSRVQGASHL